MDSRFVVLLLLCVSVPAAAGVSNDLDVGWISRHPEIEYVWNNANPKVEGWPTVGDPVTWRAHVRNWSSEAKTARNGASMAPAFAGPTREEVAQLIFRAPELHARGEFEGFPVAPMHCPRG